MIATDLVAALLWVVVTAYALTGGADFGGGIWDLLAGGARAGARVRASIDRSIAPVWEANHVWLVIALVVLWTAFPPAFGAIMSTLFVPLSLAAFGIVLRGAGFGFRSSTRSLRVAAVTGGVFALSSLITPFFLGAAVGAIVTGRVPAGGGADRMTAWTSPACICVGLLSIAAFSYLGAVYLAADADGRGEPLVGYFRRRALAAGVAVGVLGGVALWRLALGAPRIVGRLTSGPALPFLVASVLLGVAVLALLWRRRPRPARWLSAGAFTTMIWGWGVAQYPALLPGSLGLRAGAAPEATLVTEAVIVGIVAVTVGPAFVLLYRLSQRGLLDEHPQIPEAPPAP